MLICCQLWIFCFLILIIQCHHFLAQSSVCLKQLAFDVVELLLVSLFPELDSVFKELHSEKDKFGEFEVQ